MKKELIKHIRDERNNPIATLVGLQDQDGSIKIGYAKCHDSLDTFSKKWGIRIAEGRARTDYRERNVPYIVKKHMPKFVERCQKYFKCT